MAQVKLDHGRGSITVSAKQLRRLKKKKPREFWIPQSPEIAKRYAGDLHYLETEPRGGTENVFIHVKEVFKKKS